MAILFSQSDGSDQHYDTYEEFEQAMILMKRLNGEEVSQDLLDEVMEKNSDKDTGLLQVKIYGVNFESAISEEAKKATRELAEALDEVEKDRAPESDECEVPEKAPKFGVGDKVKVVENKSSGHVVGTIGEISELRYINSQNRWSYVVSPISEYLFGCRLSHNESDLEFVETDRKEFKVGDTVRVIGNSSGHYMEVGEVREITEVDSDEPKYNLSCMSYGRWANTKDIELVTG